jgi:hypothetical protein
MLPYEFRAKEIDEHQQEESIAEPSSVEEERRHEETEDPEKKEDMTFENLKAEQENVQMKSTRGKDVVIDDNAPPKMIRTKDPEVGVSNVSERKTKSARRSKPTVKQLLDTYTTRKANNVFSRLGDNKHPRSASRHGGHERRRGKSYVRQLYFAKEPTYWGDAPSVYTKFPPWGCNHWEPYHTKPIANFQLEYISQRRPMLRPHLHEKRVQFKHEIRPRAFVIRGHEEPTLGFFSPRGRRGVGDKSYKGDRKFVWVPVIPAELKASATVVSKCRRSLNGTDADHGLKPGGQKIAAGVIGVPQQQKASVLVQNEVTLELSLENREDSISHAENIVMHNGAKPGCTKKIAEKGTSQNAFSKHNVQTHSEKVVVRPCTSDSAQVSSYLCARSSRKLDADGLFNQQKNNSAKDRQFVPKTAIRHYRPRNCDVNEVGCGSVQGKPGSTEAKRAKNILVASSCTNTNKKFESASIHAVSASLCPKVVKSSANTSTPWCDSTSRCGQKILASNVFDEHRVFSAKRGIFTPQTVVCQYMSRNSGGRMIKSVTHVTKPGPRWCPTGLTPTQKRRVQRLRASRIRGKRAVKELEKWFSRDRQMVPPKMVWKKKGIVADKNTNADDMVADGISEIFRDAATHMDVDQGG